MADAEDYDRRRALHIAAEEGHEGIVLALLEAGADANCRDAWGTTPLAGALLSGHSKVAEILTAAGATPPDSEPTGPCGLGTHGLGPENVQLVRKLGRGSFGEVSLGVHVVTSERFAVKTVRAPGACERAAAHMEFRHLAHLHHPNIVRVRGFAIDGPLSFIYLDYITQGTSYDLLYHRVCGPLPHATVRRMARDVLSGLGYLHSKDMLHRDIKPSNVLVALDGGCRLSDFGLATTLKMKGRKGGLVGTARYLAPELAALGGGGTAASDIWAVGCTLCELGSARVPWLPHIPPSASHREVIKEIAQRYVLSVDDSSSSDRQKDRHARTPPPQPLHPDFPEGWPAAGTAWLRICLSLKPDERLDCRSLMQHPWLCPPAQRLAVVWYARRRLRRCQIPENCLSMIECFLEPDFDGDAAKDTADGDLSEPWCDQSDRLTLDQSTSRARGGDARVRPSVQTGSGGAARSRSSHHSVPSGGEQETSVAGTRLSHARWEESQALHTLDKSMPAGATGSFGLAVNATDVIRPYGRRPQGCAVGSMHLVSSVNLAASGVLDASIGFTGGSFDGLGKTDVLRPTRASCVSPHDLGIGCTDVLRPSQVRRVSPLREPELTGSA
eukprot:TRINITY_DN1976_c0_g2_i1.p1 TRINITY_DN1976_c0_g2~~TRINITY_DN1976_c0_g2_i1.p1  ORF type:complete len:613 (+),score=54.87 TRINITY_DN1976_c0_g2_i1:545-2383(+)